MSIYPAPNRTNIYNDVDYTSNVDENASSGEIDDRYVKKTGSTMSGMLTVPILKFADNTTQHTSYDSVLMDSTVSDVSSNTYKLSTVNYDDSTVSIPDLSCNVLNVNGIQSQAFTSSDKFMISDNAGRVALLESDISTNSGRISVLEADVSEIDSAIGYVGTAGINFIKNIKVNDVGVLIGGESALHMQSFDGYNLVLDSGDDYTDLYSRTVYMGNSNGLTIHLRSPARINMNGESQNYAFTDAHKSAVESISNKVKATIPLNYDLFDRTSPFPANAIHFVDYDYELTNHSSLDSWTTASKWSGGSRDLLITYNIFFETNANTHMKTRIIIKNGGSTRYIGDWCGVPWTEQVEATIMYSSNNLVSVIDNDEIIINVDMHRYQSPVVSEAVSGSVHFIQV